MCVCIMSPLKLGNEVAQEDSDTHTHLQHFKGSEEACVGKNRAITHSNSLTTPEKEREGEREREREREREGRDRGREECIETSQSLIGFSFWGIPRSRAASTGIGT